jgi:hypothetical protein
LEVFLAEVEDIKFGIIPKYRSFPTGRRWRMGLLKSELNV